MSRRHSPTFLNAIESLIASESNFRDTVIFRYLRIVSYIFRVQTGKETNSDQSLVLNVPVFTAINERRDNISRISSINNISFIEDG